MNSSNKIMQHLLIQIGVQIRLHLLQPARREGSVDCLIQESQHHSAAARVWETPHCFDLTQPSDTPKTRLCQLEHLVKAGILSNRWIWILCSCSISESSSWCGHIHGWDGFGSSGVAYQDHFASSSCGVLLVFMVLRGLDVFIQFGWIW